MKQRAYYRKFIFNFRYGIVFLVTVFMVLFGGRVSAANIPPIEWFQLVNYGIEQHISLNSIQTSLMFANHKSIYDRDLKMDLRQDGVVVWRKTAPMHLVIR